MRVAAVVLLFIVATGCGSQPSPPQSPPAGPAPAPPGTDARRNREVISGGGSTAAGFWVSGGNRYRDGSGPGILYGTVTPPKGQPQLLYVGLFRYPTKYERFGGVTDGGTKTDTTGNAWIVDGLTVNDQELAIRVELVADPKAGKVTREELRVAGEKLDPAKGRLILMDFTKAKAAWKQVDVDLAKALEGVDPKDAEAMGTKGVAQLRKATAAVDEFFK